MFLKSHRWVDVPGTRTEKRWAMNVRESTHTAMVFDKKYLNVETGKFDTDKLCTLNSISLNDLIDNYDDNGAWINTYIRQAKRDREHKVENVYNFPKHIPKDNDFDEELKRDNERKRLIAQQEQRRIEMEEEKKRREEEFIKQRQIYEEQRRKSREQELAYAKQLADIEARLMKERDERNERLKQAAYSRHIGNVRPNRWIPK